MKLKAKQLKALPDEVFGLPKERRYPMPDKEHVLKAIQFFGYAKPKDRKELAENINRRAKELKITVKVSPKNPFFKYVDKVNVLKESGDFVEEFHMGSLSPIVPLGDDPMEKSYIGKINDIIDSEDDKREEIKELFSDTEDTKEAFDCVYTKQKTSVPIEKTGNIDIDYKSLFYNMIIQLTKDDMISKYTDDNIRPYMSDTFNEYIEMIQKYLPVQSPEDLEDIVAILNSLDNAYLVAALAYIGSRDRVLMKSVLDKIEFSKSPLYYLPKSVRVSYHLRMPDTLSFNEYRNYVSSKKISRFINFSDRERVVCDTFVSDGSVIGRTFSKMVRHWLKSEYDATITEFNDDRNAGLQLTKMKLVDLVDCKFLSGYYIANNGAELFVKFEENSLSISKDAIYYALFITTPMGNDFCVIPIFGPSVSYRELCDDIMNDRNPNIKYTFFKLANTDVCKEGMINRFEKVKNFLNRISISNDGDIKIDLTSKSVRHMDVYDKIHRFILINKKADNIDGLKLNLCDLFTLISDIEVKYKYNKKADTTSDEYKDAIKARAFAINDFKQTLKYVLQKEPNFNFVKYYEKERSKKDSIIITKNKIKSVASLFRLIMV